MAVDHRRSFPAVIHGCVVAGELIHLPVDGTVVNHSAPPLWRVMLKSPTVPIPRSWIPGTPVEAASPVRVVEAKSPGPWPRVIGMRVPAWIIEPGTIHHHAVPHECAEISRRVSHVHPVRRGIVNIDVFHVIDRNRGWYGIDFRRDKVANAPRSLRIIRHKPDAVADGVVFSPCFDNVIG